MQSLLLLLLVSGIVEDPRPPGALKIQYQGII